METKRTAPQSTDFDPRRASKIETSPLSSSLTKKSKEKQSALGKICLIFDCPHYFVEDDFSSGEHGGWVNRCLLLLDLDAEWPKTGGEGYVPLSPNVCFSTYNLGVGGCCVLDSTLYLFGDEKTDLFSYKLPSSPLLQQGVIILTEDTVDKDRRPMKFPKNNPRGCPTPNGKILVLSCWIDSRKENSGKFELFDPKSDEGWMVLPDLLLLPQFPLNEVTFIRTYSFINNGTVLLVTTSVGNFTLDIEQPQNGWSTCDTFLFPHSSNLPRFALSSDGLCLTDWFALRAGSSDPLQWTYPGLQRDETGREMIYFCRSRGSGITWLPPSNKSFCVARSHSDPETRQPHFIMDVCSFDGDSQSSNDQKCDVVPGVTVKERFKFVLDIRARDAHEIKEFHPSGLYSMPCWEQIMAGELIREWNAIQQFPAATTQEKPVDLLGKLKNQDVNTLTILVMGKGGVGKSSTVNSIVGERVVTASAFQYETPRPVMVSRSRLGFTLNIIDTPGLVEGGYVNAQTLDMIKRFLLNKTVDVLLYVDRLDSYREDNLDKQIVKAITDNFGKNIWHKAVVVLTHAQLSPPDALSCEEFLTRRLESLLECVRQGAKINTKDAKNFAIHFALVENGGSCNKNKQDEKILPTEIPGIPNLVGTITDVALNGKKGILVDKKLIEGPNADKRGKIFIFSILAFAIPVFLCHQTNTTVDQG